MTRKTAVIGLIVAVGVVSAVSAAWLRQSAPDIGRIAYLSSQDGQAGIFLMRGDGSNQRRLTTGPDQFHVWSGDGCTVAFRRQIAQIYTVPADAGSPTLAVTTIGDDPSGDIRPDLSPDGKRLVFAGRMDREMGKNVFAVNADGTSLTNLTHAADRFQEHYHPAWSPDATRIAFTANGVGGVWVVNADGSGLHRVIDGGGFFWMPDRSGLLVAMADGFGVIDPAAPVAASASKRAEPQEARFAYSLSPDGSMLAYVSARKDDTTWIGVMRRDGTDARKLADLSPDDIILYMAGPAAMPPAWSPDGSRLAFGRLTTRRQGRAPDGRVVTVGGAVDIYTVGIDGSGLTQLTHDGVSAAPAWARSCR